jgi:hypothetical protein
VLIRLEGIGYLAHRLAWVYMTGEQPDVIDHINRERDDNRFSNLRNGTFKDNSTNVRKYIRSLGRHIEHKEKP